MQSSLLLMVMCSCGFWLAMAMAGCYFATLLYGLAKQGKPSLRPLPHNPTGLEDGDLEEGRMGYAVVEFHTAVGCGRGRWLRMSSLIRVALCLLGEWDSGSACSVLFGTHC